MIIKNNSDDIQTIGDIETIKTTIDPKNIEFITSLLSSNLYSQPEKSFMREIVSNAWDSHVEAGNTDTPVVIKFSVDSNYNTEITIRDYGTGLSEERFKELYCSLGSSTKRESNDYIGGFGIGRMSQMACTSISYITSYYNGIMYSYVMVKEGNAIVTNLVSKKETDEPNGLEVTIKGISNSYPYKKGLDSLVFFPNLYVEGDNSFNLIKIRRFKFFSVAQNNTYPEKLLLGNVLYPLDTSVLNSKTNSLFDRLKWSGAVINFEVGELTVTPNRENIIYTSETTSKIVNRIEEAIKEVDEEALKRIKLDYTDIIKLHVDSTSTCFFDAINDTVSLSSKNNWAIPTYIHQNSLTYKGKPVNFSTTACRVLSSTTYMQIPEVIALMSTRGDFSRGKRILNRATFKYVDKVLMLPQNAKFTNTVKEYICDKYDGESYYITRYVNESAFTNYILDKCSLTLTEKDSVKGLLHEMWLSYSSRCVNIDLSTQEFTDFKAELKEQNKAPKIEDVSIKAVNNYRNYYHKFSNVKEVISWLLRKWSAVVLLTTEEYQDVSSKRLYLNYPYDDKVELYVLNKRLYSYLTEELKDNKCIYTYSRFCREYRPLIYAATWRYCQSTIYNSLDALAFIEDIKEYLPYKVQSAIDDVIYYRNKAKKPIGFENAFCGEYNQNIINAFEALKTSLNPYKEAYDDCKEEDLFDWHRLPIEVKLYSLWRRNKIRLNYKGLTKLKNNKLIQFLWQK